MIEIEKALRQAVDPFRLSSSLKNRHRPGWRFLLFTTKPSVIVFRPTWKVNVKRMVLTSSRKWGQPPAVVCSACCRCSLKSTSHFVTQCNKLLQPHHKLWATPHNSKCQYGERGAADAKPKAQIILDAAKVSAASGGNSEPKQGQRSQSARGFCPPKHDAGTATRYYRAFWQRRCRSAAAGAVLKPQGGNCAVLP